MSNDIITKFFCLYEFVYFNKISTKFHNSDGKRIHLMMFQIIIFIV